MALPSFAQNLKDVMRVVLIGQNGATPASVKAMLIKEKFVRHGGFQSGRFGDRQPRLRCRSVGSEYAQCEWLRCAAAAAQQRTCPDTGPDPLGPRRARPQDPRSRLW